MCSTKSPVFPLYVENRVNVRTEVLTEVTMQITFTVLWYATSCSLVEMYRSSIMKMVA
jgi:hypothetical protein